jgi:hypothetical protein
MKISWVRTILVGAVCLIALTKVFTVYATNYGDALGKSIISAVIGKDDQKYWKPVAYPTDNFGIGTLYDGKGAGSLLCATSTCLGLANNNTDTLTAAGYIASGTGGSVDLTDTQKRTLGINAVVKLFALLNITGNYDSNKTTVVTVEVPKATVRYLLKGQLSSRISTSPSSAAVTDAYNHRRIRAIVGDIVVESLVATVKVDDSVSVGVKATLDQNVGQALGKDSSLGLTYSKTGNGEYKIKTVSPVIVAVEPAKQPQTGSLESGDNPWPADMTLPLTTDNP